MGRVAMDVEPNSDTWLSARRNGIGASDLPVIIGISKWSQPRTLYHEKRGELERSPETRPQRMGKLLEPAAVQGFQEDMGIEVVQYPAPMFRRENRPRHMATPDAMLASGDLLEAKTSSSFAETWAKPYDEVPDIYYVQAQWQMYITETERVWFSLLMNGSELHYMSVDRDDEGIDDLIIAADAFLEMLDSGTPPEWQPENVDIDTVKRLYTQFSGEVVELSDDTAKRWAEFERLSREARDLTKEAQSLKASVMADVGNADAGALPDGGYVRRKTINKAERIQAASSYIDFRYVKKM